MLSSFQSYLNEISASADIMMEGEATFILANPKSIEIQARLFRGFSDLSRLSILDVLREGVLTVTEIVEATGLTQSNVSNHLACLRDCGLVVTEQEGRFVYYQLSDKRVAKLLDLADELLADVAKGVYECTRHNVKVSKNGKY